MLVFNTGILGPRSYIWISRIVELQILSVSEQVVFTTASATIILLVTTNIGKLAAIVSQLCVNV